MAFGPPHRALTIGLAIAAICTWPLFHINIGLPTSGWFPEGTESSLGARAIEQTGSRGALLPLQITFQAPPGARVVGSRCLTGLMRFSDSLLANPRVSTVRGPVNLRDGMSRLAYLGLYGDLDRARERYPDFLASYIAPDGRTTVMDVVLADSTSLPGAMDVVRQVRGSILGGVRGLDSVNILVGGFAAASLDLQEDLLSGFPMVVGLVVGITGLMLLVAFRTGPPEGGGHEFAECSWCVRRAGARVPAGDRRRIVRSRRCHRSDLVVIPVIVFAVVFGLSMDYEVFLLSRMKEAFDRTHKNDLATMEGLSVTASVITSAAAIMIIVFGTFAFSRVLAAKMMGFGLAMAVFLDATLVRMVLVPAFMHIAGRWNWWPGVKVPADTERSR